MKKTLIIVLGFVIVINLIAWFLVSRDQPKWNDGLWEFVSEGNSLEK